MPSIRLRDVRFHVVRTETRFPFRYGIAAMTEVPHLFLRGEFEIGGESAAGFSAEGLPPKWFTKDPGTAFAEDLAEMLQVISRAVAGGIAEGTGETFYDWWRALYQSQADWARERGIPPLLAHLGTSLVERAGIDALCRASGRPFAELARANAFGLRPGEIHPELADLPPDEAVRRGLDGRGRGGIEEGWVGDVTGSGDGADGVRRGNKEGFVGDSTGSGFEREGECSRNAERSGGYRRLFVRHTVGLADPLLDEDILEEDRADDGLPQSLEACIAAGGLRFFKIKLRGDLPADGERLRRLSALLGRVCPEARFTLDGNEQYETLAEFRAHWEAHRDHPVLRAFLAPPGLLFVEQPLRRDAALAGHVAHHLAAWPEAPPLIIDESDAELDSARRALDLGYAGTSHKNCKGVMKSLANAALLARRAADSGQRFILSGEDLANTGPVALLQDLAVMAALGIGHVERNGHHYFKGLSAFGEGVNARVLECHGDLYLGHPGGFASLALREGWIEMGSVASAPFGSGFRADEVLEPWLTLDEWRAAGIFDGY